MREAVCLNSKWAFTKNSEAIPDRVPADWYFVNLPHTWNGIDGQDGAGDYYRGKCRYVRKLAREEIPEAESYYLEFRGVNSVADVFVNGEKVAHHKGGYSTFRAEITPYLKDENIITVDVDNSDREDVYPRMADFTFYGGIYRDVYLICVPEAHFDLDYYGSKGITVTTVIEGNRAKGEISAFVTNKKEGQHLVFTVEDKDGNRVFSEKTEDEKISFTLENVKLWHGRKHPYLYTAAVELIEDGKAIDRVDTRFGCRSFAIDPEKGFFLNGLSYPLRGVSRHQDRPVKGNAISREDHREDIELICEMGANTIRLAHYQHDQYFYDLCDEMGMIVWAEIPYISHHVPEARENSLQQMKELIAQNYNHPSVVVWGLSNEITMNGSSDEDLLENHRALNELCHEMDKTRLTTIACVSMCDTNDPYIRIPDVIAYNHYFGWYGGDTSMNGPWFDKFHKDFPHIPIGVSEYGCEALDWHTSKPQQGDYTEEYQAFYHEELIKQFFTRDYLWATYVWNMFDFGADARNEGGENGMNHKGLVSFDRKYKKDSFYAYKAWLSEDPFVHICGKRYVDRVEEYTKVTVYSNFPEVELYVNGTPFAKQRSDNRFFLFEVPNRGETHLIAKAGDCKDSSVIRKVDAFNEKYRLKEKGAILNWFDITEPEGYFSLNDKLGEILATEGGKRLFAGFMKSMTGAPGTASFAGFEMNESMLKMMNGFTVLRLTNLLGTAGIKFSKEQLLDINSQLNRIKKEQ